MLLAPNFRIKLFVTGVRYRGEIICPLTIPGLGTTSPNSVPQDDNARPHRARVAIHFLQQQRVIWMDWPAYSPDLVPIEHACDKLGRRLHDNFVSLAISTKSPSRIAIISQTFVNSMQNRCSECLEQEVVLLVTKLNLSFVTFVFQPVNC